MFEDLLDPSAPMPSASRGNGRRLRVSCFRFRVPGLGNRNSGFGFRVSGFKIRVSGSRYGVSDVGEFSGALEFSGFRGPWSFRVFGGLGVFGFSGALEFGKTGGRSMSASELRSLDPGSVRRDPITKTRGVRGSGSGFRVWGLGCRRVFGGLGVFGFSRALEFGKTGARSMRASELRSLEPGSVRRDPITTHAIECALQRKRVLY